LASLRYFERLAAVYEGLWENLGPKSLAGAPSIQMTRGSLPESPLFRPGHDRHHPAVAIVVPTGPVLVVGDQLSLKSDVSPGDCWVELSDTYDFVLGVDAGQRDYYGMSNPSFRGRLVVEFSCSGGFAIRPAVSQSKAIIASPSARTAADRPHCSATVWCP
jgi:hypothetical protein